MTAAAILELLRLFGPGAIRLVQALAAVWSKPALTVEEVNEICKLAQKSYDDYITEARARD